MLGFHIFIFIVEYFWVFDQVNTIQMSLKKSYILKLVLALN